MINHHLSSDKSRMLHQDFERNNQASIRTQWKSIFQWKSRFLFGPTMNPFQPLLCKRCRGCILHESVSESVGVSRFNHFKSQCKSDLAKICHSAYFMYTGG